jgi:hypothetical protein
MEITMSNSSRIETATRQHVGAVLTSQMIAELVKVSFPDWKGGVYPSDAAGKRLEDGTLTHRGKVAYGDLVLEYLAENSFKVLPTADIVRRPTSRKKAAATLAMATPAAATSPVPVPTPTEAPKATGKKAGKKASKSASVPPVATKQKARSGAAVQ